MYLAGGYGTTRLSCRAIGLYESLGAYPTTLTKLVQLVNSNKLRAHTSILLGATIRMAQPRAQAQKPLLTQEQLKKKLEISNFEPNSILRGAQLTVVGGQYALPCIINMPGPPADQIQL